MSTDEYVSLSQQVTLCAGGRHAKKTFGYWCWCAVNSVVLVSSSVLYVMVDLSAGAVNKNDIQTQAPALTP